MRVVRGYLDRLTDRYRALVLDYPKLGPGIGRTDRIPASELTADRYCADLLAVADRAGFDRFAYWGYSFGGVVGLQLATRTNRLTALICGGWPPLGGPYPEMLEITRQMAATRGMPVWVDQFATFYESIQKWPEAESVARISCPRMTFFGSEDEIEYPDGVALRLAPTIRERREELERLGWHVAEVPERDHSLFMDPAATVPVVREFLDRVL